MPTAPTSMTNWACDSVHLGDRLRTMWLQAPFSKTDTCAWLSSMMEYDFDHHITSECCSTGQKGFNGAVSAVDAIYIRLVFPDRATPNRNHWFDQWLAQVTHVAPIDPECLFNSNKWSSRIPCTSPTIISMSLDTNRRTRHVKAW